jgi:hypothetical protein
MDDESDQHVEDLERSMADLKYASAQVLGFLNTVEYEGITFNVSRRFVIADLSPLAFFHLIEPIEPSFAGHADRGVNVAIVALHHRLIPLLSCQHEWTPLKRADDEGVLGIMSPEGLRSGLRPRVCKACTAYALGQALPVVGRS